MNRADAQQVAQHLLDALGSLGAEHGRMGGRELARHKHIPDNIRWGDTKKVVLPGPVPGPIAGPSSQIARIDYEHSTTWGLTLIVDIPDGLVGEVGNFDVDFDVIIGVGSASVTLKRRLVVSAASLAASRNQAADLFQVPSKSISIAAAISAAATVASHDVFFSALACPLVL